MFEYRQCGIDGLPVFSSGAKTEAGRQFLRDVAAEKAGEDDETPGGEGIDGTARLRQELPTEVAGKPLVINEDREDWSDDGTELFGVITEIAIKGGNTDGTDTVLRFNTSNYGETYDPNFRVNGRFGRDPNVPRELGQPLLSSARKIFENHMSRLEDGSRIRAIASNADGSAIGRETTYIRWGFSPPDRTGAMLGVVENGKVVAADRRYRRIDRSTYNREVKAWRARVREERRQQSS